MPLADLSPPAPETIQLETARTILRPARTEDASVLYDAATRPGFVEWMTWAPPSSLAVIERHFEVEQELWRQGKGFAFSVVEKVSGSVFAGAKLRPDLLDRNPDVCSLGYWTHPDFQRRGLATEFVQQVTHFAFTDLAQTSVLADVALDNEPSHRLLRRLGFVAFERNISRSAAKRLVNLRYRLRRVDFQKRIRT